MELLSRPRHQLRAQGRRRDQAGVVFVSHERRARWRPARPALNSASVPVHPGQVSTRSSTASGQSQPDELLDFIARTAVESEKEFLLEYETQVQMPQSVDAFARFKRSLVNVRSNDRTGFRRDRGSAATRENETAESLAQSIELASGSNSLPLDQTVPPAPCPTEENQISEEDPFASDQGQSSDALRTLLGALNDWLSAGNSHKPTAADSTLVGKIAQGRGFPNSSNSESTRSSLSFPASGRLGVNSARSTAAASPDSKGSLDSSSSVYGALASTSMKEEDSHTESSGAIPRALSSFSLDAWRNPLASGSQQAPSVAPSTRANLLATLQETACKTQVRVKSLPQGRRLECHENGAVLEKDEFGRVTQVRTRVGEILSIYYGQDGAAEGFVRTDARGRLHSVGDVDANGVTVRDNNGRLRALGESLSIDSNGKLSICRSDGQYWSLDLLRELMVEKRKLCNEQGTWTSMTAIFAGDGFRMMTHFQDLEDPTELMISDQRVGPPSSGVSNLGPDAGRFRFYGRDGSMIEFLSEQELASLLPTYVSAPGVRPIEPRWQSKHQAGTAWNSVQEFLLINQSA